MTVSNLPMYDLPELRVATDAWWQGLAAAMRGEGMRDVPEHLSRADDDAAFWRQGALLLSQTCGYPLMTEFKDDLKLIGTPHYDVAGCDGPRYCSWIIVRQDHPAQVLADLRGEVCALNNIGSHSGMNALRHTLAPLAEGEAFFSQVRLSGGHRQSIEMVTDGRADVAAIDCVTWGLIESVAAHELAGVRILAETEKVPGLPYVTTAGADDRVVGKLRSSVMQALDSRGLADACQALRISGFSETSLVDYQVILDMAQQAVDQGYPELR
ncbi:MAG: PhnD/SsuA/transferrin family substrate-binding protein [Alphaproteobacteria bacterium]|jgi:ABC-type phosphate/phosphonate transport system substrate-binding protein|nr:PhnD/SsuA/transferrin family substrate-binding protein [Alphaproteobacteria bacterium]MBT4085269.1 PhnD/SsuA/transferrin family substrate-binding protein [Alphaproteobacteria bacterium]MBT4544204.1 PhnD/SsuA/transferrin family substrate-binding protein [Alphaproteobacteria bacterium]MBT7747430.1 PhnD/SsuA/transferrin family substrate-binding protein [Alphaproteobacteria bacterium]